MAKKRTAEHIYEPDEDKTHYGPPSGLDQVTLCGVTDWVRRTKGEITTRPVNCNSCLTIVKFVKGMTFD